MLHQLRSNINHNMPFAAFSCLCSEIIQFYRCVHTLQEQKCKLASLNLGHPV